EYSARVQFHYWIAELCQRVAYHLLVSHYQNHHALDQQLFASERVDFILGDRVDDLALPINIVSGQPVLEYSSQETRFLCGCLIGQCITLTNGCSHKCQLPVVDAGVAEAG